MVVTYKGGTVDYSKCKEEIGSIFDALSAGKIPNIIPISIENRTPPITTGIVTRNGHSAK